MSFTHLLWPVVHVDASLSLGPKLQIVIQQCC